MMTLKVINSRRSRVRFVSTRNSPEQQLAQQSRPVDGDDCELAAVERVGDVVRGGSGGREGAMVLLLGTGEAMGDGRALWSSTVEQCEAALICFPVSMLYVSWYAPCGFHASVSRSREEEDRCRPGLVISPGIRSGPVHMMSSTKKVHIKADGF